MSGRRASLSDLKSVDDIEDLSVRQLKEILARNFVDYKGCCEKWELMERVTRLYQDQQNLLGEDNPTTFPVYRNPSEHLGSNGSGPVRPVSVLVLFQSEQEVFDWWSAVVGTLMLTLW